MSKKRRQEAVNEVHVLKGLSSPYIVAYKESFLQKKCLCIVMDYADGGDLYTRIAKQRKQHKSFEESQVINWFIQICLGLKHIHEHKILHRDMKAQNIFLTSKGGVKIGDFGIARVLEDTCELAQTAIGTPFYLSPEICEKKPYNHKSDIWSLGCILYEMLMLRHPFESTNMGGLVLAIMTGNYSPISKEFSEQIRFLVKKMLNLNPDERPSINEIIELPFLKSKIPRFNARCQSTLGKNSKQRGCAPNSNREFIKNNEQFPEESTKSRTV